MGAGVEWKRFVSGLTFRAPWMWNWMIRPYWTFRDRGSWFAEGVIWLVVVVVVVVVAVVRLMTTTTTTTTAIARSNEPQD